MRILDIINEAKEKIYAIGDSHAVAIAQAGGFVNLATNGRSAFSSDNDGAVGKVPAGSTVILSAGANDMLNSNKSGVVNRVQELVNTLKQKKCKVYYVLFAETDNPKFAKDRNQLRNQVAAEVGDIARIIDMGSLRYDPKAKKDGIHAPMSWYSGAAKKVLSGTDAAPAAPKEPGAQSAPATTTTPAAKEQDNNPVSNVDIKGLIGNHLAGGGAAGSAAILGGGIVDKIKNMIGRATSDKVPPKDTVATTPGKTTPGKAKPLTSSSNTVDPGSVKQYLSSKGLDKFQVAGIMANIKHESSFRPGVLGDNGTSGGLFQHHAERFTAMRNAAGPNWQTNWKGQIDFALSEPAGQQYAGKRFSSPQEATKWWTINFEIPANKVAQARIRSQSASEFA